jgi:hypothetical protein
MIVVDGSYWELVWMQQISWREILLGDQIPKDVGSIHSIAIDRGEPYKVILFAQRKHVII